MHSAPWPFETSLAVFLVIAFASQAITIATKSRLSLQFGLGAICIAGFAIGVFPPDFVERSKMKDVGFIAFNVLVVHSGTLVDFGSLRREWRPVAVTVSAIAVMTAALAFGLPPLIGRTIAVIAPGTVVGGGAACAIASNVLAGAHPSLAAFPWLVFMMQGLIGAPLSSWAHRKAIAGTTPDARRVAGGGEGTGEGTVPSLPETVGEHPALCGRVPDRYKTTAYYLGALMLVSVFNRWASGAFFAGIGLGINVTALIFGMLLGRIGLLDRNPLAKSDSFGFLMLGLMALMANTLARTPVNAIPPLALFAVVAAVSGTLVLAAAGALTGRIFRVGAYQGMAIAVHCTVGFPSALGRIPAFTASSILAGNVLSIFLVSAAANFLVK
jgi:hypothetical protein